MSSKRRPNVMMKRETGSSLTRRISVDDEDDYVVWPCGVVTEHLFPLLVPLPLQPLQGNQVLGAPDPALLNVSQLLGSESVSSASKTSRSQASERSERREGLAYSGEQGREAGSEEEYFECGCGCGGDGELWWGEFVEETSPTAPYVVDGGDVGRREWPVLLPSII